MSPNTQNTSKTYSEEQKTGGMVGWICPVCGRGLSPFTSVCPCKPFTPTITYVPYRYYSGPTCTYTTTTGTSTKEN